jgi:O-succinylbenzoic acid--CoA ligase
MSVFRISSAAREAPDRPALIADGRTWTWRELADRTLPICARLDLPPGSRVVVRADNRLETVLVLLALLERGITIVPLHPRWTAAEVERSVRDAEPALALLDQGTIATLASAGPMPKDEGPEPDPDATLAMLYTSGTTGRPKGALLSRRAFAASAAASAERLGWRPRDRWLLTLPLCHVGGLSVLTRCLAARRCLVLQPRFEPHALLAAIEHEGVTLASVVPTMLSVLLAADARNLLSRLRVLLVGGAAAARPLLVECAARRLAVVTTYGLTEACSQVATQVPRRGRLQQGVGRPLAGMEVRAVGPDGEPLADGEIGTLQIRGPARMIGYWRSEPLGPAWLDTGDLGHLDARGKLHVAARRTDLVVTGGENVYPAEVEAALLACPGVRDALVFGVEDPLWGQCVAAAVVLTPGHVKLPERAMLAGLAPYRRPRLGCVVDALPLTAAGKPDRAAQELRDRLLPWPR